MTGGIDAHALQRPKRFFGAARKLSNRRTFPAFDILSSSTRRDDLLLSEDELNQAWILHRLLSTMNVVEGMEFIINKMKQYKTNDELFESLKKTGGAASANSTSNGNGSGNYLNNGDSH